MSFLLCLIFFKIANVGGRGRDCDESGTAPNRLDHEYKERVPGHRVIRLKVRFGLSLVLDYRLAIHFRL